MLPMVASWVAGLIVARNWQQRAQTPAAVPGASGADGGARSGGGGAGLSPPLPALIDSLPLPPREQAPEVLTEPEPIVPVDPSPPPDPTVEPEPPKKRGRKK